MDLAEYRLEQLLNQALGCLACRELDRRSSNEEHVNLAGNHNDREQYTNPKRKRGRSFPCLGFGLVRFPSDWFEIMGKERKN